MRCNFELDVQLPLKCFWLVLFRLFLFGLPVESDPPLTPMHYVTVQCIYTVSI